ncbi:MAG: Trm112 family protein [Woeseia sp.]
MDKRLLGILCCPISHKGLALARGDLLKKVNAAIAARRLANREGETLSEALGEALVTDDGKLLYPVRDGIPVLLESESIGLEQLDGA